MNDEHAAARQAPESLAPKEPGHRFDPETVRSWEEAAGGYAVGDGDGFGAWAGWRERRR